MKPTPVERCPVCGKPMPGPYARRLAHRKSKAHLAAEARLIAKHRQKPPA